MFIHLNVFTESKKSEIKPTKRADYFEVFVKEPAEENKANKKVLSLAKDFFKTKRIKLVKGHQSPKKIIEIDENK